MLPGAVNTHVVLLTIRKSNSEALGKQTKRFLELKLTNVHNIYQEDHQQTHFLLLTSITTLYVCIYAKRKY